MQYVLIWNGYFGCNGKIRKVNLTYRNFSENTNRETHRAVRQLVLIHAVYELSLLQELAEMSSKAVLNSLQKI